MSVVTPITPPQAMRDALLTRIWQSMGEDETTFFLTADFGSPVLDKIRADFPGRFINVGIAEQNLINVAAGLALEGRKVFAYAIMPFLTMRCYEQIRISLALLSHVRPMNVTLIGVGAGYSYVVSGPTHQCYEDITLMRVLPGMRVLSPADHVSAAALYDTCVAAPGIKYLRFDAQLVPVIYGEAPDAKAGFHVHAQGKQICLIATGYMLHTALAVAKTLTAEGISTGVIDLFDLSQFDGEKLRDALAPHAGLVSMEEAFRGRGGLDALLFNFKSEHGLTMPFLNLGVDNHYSFELGSRAELHEQVGIGPASAAARIRDFVKRVK